RIIVDFAVVFAASDERGGNLETGARDDRGSRRQFKSTNGRGDESSAGKSGRSRRWQDAERRSATTVGRMNAERPTSNAERRSQTAEIGRWMLDVGRWALSYA